jgi:hypothetical protein
LDLKRCAKCGNDYPATSEYFSKHIKCKDGFRSHCKECHNKEKKVYREKSGRKWYENIISSSRKRSHDLKMTFDINVEFLKELREIQKGVCYWLNMPIDFTMVDKLRRPSIDRLDNSKGYTKDNVVLTTQFANLGRQSSTEADFRIFLEKYIKNN